MSEYSARRVQRAWIVIWHAAAVLQSEHWAPKLCFSEGASHAQTMSALHLCSLLLVQVHVASSASFATLLHTKISTNVFMISRL